MSLFDLCHSLLRSPGIPRILRHSDSGTDNALTLSATLIAWASCNKPLFMVLFSFSTRKAIVSLILEEHLVSLEFRTIVPKVLQGNRSWIFSTHTQYVTSNGSLKSYYLRNYRGMGFIFTSRIFYATRKMFSSQTQIQHHAFDLQIMVVNVWNTFHTTLKGAL